MGDEYLVILGPTGSGKTVLLESLAGLRDIAGGRVCLNGKDITHEPPENRYLGFAYQDGLLYNFLSVRENVLFGARAREWRDRRYPEDGAVGGEYGDFPLTGPLT